MFGQADYGTVVNRVERVLVALRYNLPRALRRHEKSHVHIVDEAHRRLTGTPLVESAAADADVI